MRDLISICESYDPLVMDGPYASFIFVNGEFSTVSYQGHSRAIAKLLNIDSPGLTSNTYHEFDQKVRENHIVRGVYQYNTEQKNGYLGLDAQSFTDIKMCYHAFVGRYPVPVDEIVYDCPDNPYMGKDVRDRDIRRRFGRNAS